MLNAALIAARVACFTLLLTGVAYPLLVTGLAQLLFPHQANGSLVQDDRGRVCGSLTHGRYSHRCVSPGTGNKPKAEKMSLVSGSNFGSDSKKRLRKSG